MSKYNKSLLLSCFLLPFFTSAQQPKYTFKKFVSTDDTVEFKRIVPQKDGFERTYILTNTQVIDLDDDSTTFIKGGVHALLCFEGNLKDHKREGIISVYLIDSADQSKRYKLWEQSYSHDKLNGLWKTYTLRGTLVSFSTFRDDSVNGIMRQFWIDGKTIMDEREFFNGHNKFISREYYKNGKVEKKTPVENGEVTGTAKKYYETGTLQETAEVRNGQFDGVRKYYYPNGQLWIEQIWQPSFFTTTMAPSAKQ